VDITDLFIREAGYVTFVVTVLLSFRSGTWKKSCSVLSISVVGLCGIVKGMYLQANECMSVNMN
jgi:hypothetical protein